MSIVVVTSRSFSSGEIDLIQRLAEQGHDVVRAPADHALDALAPVLAEASAWIAGTGPVTAAHLAAAPRLRVLARYGVGYDAVDLRAATAAGVVVTNTPGANSGAVADHALALMLAGLRGITVGDRKVRRGDWSVNRGRELGSLTVGIIGFGRIGQGVAQRLGGFGCQILVHDPYITAGSLSPPVEIATLPQLAARSDVVTLHAPGGTTLVDAAWVDQARPGQLIVNTARADLVDETAVADALRAGVLSGYAADTLGVETGAAQSPLLDTELADRVIITPHLGAQTVQAVDRMGSMAVDDVVAVLAGRPPAFPVTQEEKS